MTDSSKNVASVDTGGFEEFKATCPILVSFDPFSTASGNPIAANAYSFDFAPVDFVTSGISLFSGLTPIQSQRLQYNFQLYQEFQMPVVSWHYQPRWTLGSQPVAAQDVITGVNITSGTGTAAVSATYPYLPNTSGNTDVYGNNADYANDMTITVLGDKTDAQIGSGGTSGAPFTNGILIAYNNYTALDEMFQARLMKNAHVFSSRNSASGAVATHSYDLVNNSNLQGSFSATLGNQGVDQGYNVSAQLSPWYPCRAKITQGTTDAQYNWYQQLLGLKMWVYNPYNRSANTNANAYPIGQMWFTYTYRFRNREFRPFFNLVTITDLTPADKEEVRKYNEQLAHAPPALRDLKRLRFNPPEQDTLHDPNHPIRPIPTLANQTARDTPAPAHPSPLELLRRRKP